MLAWSVLINSISLLPCVLEGVKPQYENTITYKSTENLNMRILLLTREHKTSI